MTRQKMASYGHLANYREMQMVVLSMQ